ncbi:manganese efflux pump [Candidatus Bathyarchaeota archaeon]|nr:manganese efflux pump [Candidatus Bathyarchaeota archaeon]
MALETGIDVYSLLLLSVGLAMDAFSVATVTGFGLSKIKISDATRMSISFGAAHTLMPIAGWVLGSTIVNLVSDYDHWVAFLLLFFVGGRMVMEGLDGDGEVDPNEILGTVSLIMFTVAVSIDALAVGLSFRLENLPILVPSLFMGTGTLLFTFVGLLVGNRTGKAFGKKAQIMGGLVLIGIGARIVFTHLV